MTYDYCDCCEINRATRKDYRTDETGGTSKYYVCDMCITIDQEWFNKIRNASTFERKKFLLRQIIDEEYWKQFNLLPPEEIPTIVSWRIETLWNNGEIKHYSDIPDDVSQVVDDWLTEIKNKIKLKEE